MGKEEVKWLCGQLGLSPERLGNPASFNERLTVQKAVFLLRREKVSPFSEYAFSMYLHGPYSPALAGDYYGLNNVRAKPVRLNRVTEKRLKWFTRKKPRWLEIASSILSIKERYSEVSSEDVYSTLTLSKPWVERSQYEEIWSELASRGL